MSDDEADREYRWNSRVAGTSTRHAPRFVRAKGEAASGSVKSSSSSDQAPQDNHASWYRDLLNSRAPSPSLQPQTAPTEDTHTPSASTSSSSAQQVPPPPLSFSEPSPAPAAPTLPQFCDLCQTTFTLPVASHQRSLAHVLKRDAATPVQLPTYYQLGSGTVGYQALQRAGWTDAERGLGAEEQGAKAPLKAVEKKDKLGIGLQKVDAQPLKEKRKGLDHRETLKKVQRDKATFKRLYAQVNDSEVEWHKMYG